MDLNERKIKILEAIINDYIHTAEPIGSRTIAKKYNLGISSATIRNEMSDLEDMGYIIQPHASAGRVPSDKGYRLYVDRLMHYRELTAEESAFLQNMIASNINQIDYLMRETAKAVSMLTHYTTIVSEPHVSRTYVKHIQLIPLDERSILMVLVTDGKVVKNHVVPVAKAPDRDMLHQLSELLNEGLQGQALEELDEQTVDALAVRFGGYADILQSLLHVLADAVGSADGPIYTSGVKNILGFPEFSDLEKAKGIFQTLEERDMLITILGRESVGNMQIVIGTENSLVELKDCSIIKANYMLGDGNYGSIGIIGPTRMDYAQAVSVLNGIIKKISHVIQALSGG